MNPTLTVLPLFSALQARQTQTVTLALRVTAPLAVTDLRPPLNLALVIDRSGSMAGQKLHVARRAAQAVVDLLRPSDRVSVIAFDSTIEVIVPSTLATDRAGLKAAIERIALRGSTALHGGWLEGASQVAAHLAPGALNRVLLLSDGQANVGLTDSDRIASDVRGLIDRGIGTSTFGMGDDYDEVLLEAMAVAGDGNYVHIDEDHLARLSDLFVGELLGLGATVGRLVSLGLETVDGVIVQDVLNDLPKTDHGRYRLPNLIGGLPVDVVARVQVESPEHDPCTLARVRLAWTDAQGTRHVLRQDLRLPVVDAPTFAGLTPDPEVQALVTMLEGAQARQAALAALERGDVAGARELVRRARNVVETLPEDAVAFLLSERSDLDALSAALDDDNLARSRKLARSQVHRAYRSKRD